MWDGLFDLIVVNRVKLASNNVPGVRLARGRAIGGGRGGRRMWKGKGEGRKSESGRGGRGGVGKEGRGSHPKVKLDLKSVQKITDARASESDLT